MSNEKDNGAKPTAEGSKEPQAIFKAELVEKDGKKDIAHIYYTKHIPTLDCVVQQLSYDIIELRAIEKTKQEKAKLSLLVKNPMTSLNQFLNRKKR